MNDYLKSAFNYTGQKYKLLEQLFEYFPEQTEFDVFVDAFCGGGSVFVNTNYKNIIANDIIKPLFSFYKEIQDSENFDILKENISKYILDKEDKDAYNISRDKFNEDGAVNPYHFFCLLQSCTNNMMRFNKKFKFNQTFGKRTYNKNTEQKLIQKCEQHNKKMFVYIDPPYYISEAGYNAFWSKQLEEDLYKYIDKLDSLGHMFLMSNISKHKGVDNPYLDKVSKYNIIELDFDYDRVSRKSVGETVEIIVKNF